MLSCMAEGYCYRLRMRRMVAAMLILSACSDRPATRTAEPEWREEIAPAPIDDLTFRDVPLQSIAANLIRQARARGITTSTGRSRVERLIALESSVGGSDLAINRVNRLTADLARTDGSQWAKLRGRAADDFSRCDDGVGRRVSEMLQRWQRRRLEHAFRFLSSNYTTPYLTTMEWERRFHQFVQEQPMDAATWGWLVLREYSAAAGQQYGHADAETAYRYYLESSGLGDGRESRDLFSVPGVAITRSSSLRGCSSRSETVAGR
jgi:hypothetical protein